MRLNKFFKEVGFWLLIVLIQLFGISAISLGFGFKPISEATLIILGTLLIVNGATRLIVQWNAEDKHKEKSKLFKGWRTRVSRLIKIIKIKLTYQNKELFTIEANEREQKSHIDQKLDNNGIDIYFYNEGKVRVEKYKHIKGKKAGEKELEKFDVWLKKQDRLSKKQKRILKKILINKIKYKKHTVAELNTFGKKKNAVVYDTKDHTTSAKAKDFATWLVVASIIFLGISSILLDTDQNIWYAVTQSLFMIISVSFNIIMASRNGKKYVDVDKVDYFKELDAYYCDALKYCDIDFEKELKEIADKEKIKGIEYEETNTENTKQD